MKKITLKKRNLTSFKPMLIAVILGLYSTFATAQWEAVEFFGSDVADPTPTSISFNSLGTIMAGGFERSMEFAGRVVVYAEFETGWEPLGSPIVGQIENGEFGGEVVLNASGSRLLVSQRSTTSATGISGSYFVYEFVNNDWQQLGNRIDFPEGIRFQSFAKSLAFNDVGDRVVLTSGFDVIDGVLSGNVTVLDFDGNDWVQVGQTIMSTSGIENDFFGSAVAVDAGGDRIIVSAAGDRDGLDGPVNEGYAAIYEFVDGDWEELAIIDNPENSIFSEAVVTMSSDGNTITISSNNDSLNDVGPFQFRTRAFETADGGTTWTQIGNDISPPFDSEVLARRDIEINDAGTLIAIAYSVRMPSDDIDGSGQVRFHQRQGDSWVLLDDVITGNQDVFGFYGEALALNGAGNRVGIVNFSWEEGLAGGLLEIYENDNVLSVNSDELSTVSFFPNPSSNRFTIDLGTSTYSGSVKIVGMTGRLVYQDTVSNTSRITIDHSLSTGTYLVTLDNATTLKLLVN